MNYNWFRRAGSHNIKRLPKSYRRKALAKQVDTPTLSKKKTVRMRFLKKKYLDRQKKKGWLETHIWHAKRMKMVDIWGFRLADRPTDKCLKSLYRSSKNTCFMHDQSYLKTLEFTVLNKKKFCQFLMKFLNPNGSDISHQMFSNGVLRGKTLFYESYPNKLICPVEFVWAPDNSVFWV